MKILMAIWAEASWHPAFVATSQMFSERGDFVHILSRTPNPRLALPNKADFGTARVSPIGSGRKGWRSRLDYLKFVQRTSLAAERLKPDVIIGYDLYGMVAAYVASFRAPAAQLIYHNFDYSPKSDASGFARLLKPFELAGARKANTVLISSLGRAGTLREEARLKEEPLVVMNCQRLHSSLKNTGELDALLKDKGLKFERKVVRLGMIVPGNAIEATIRSVRFWEGNWGLVLAGVPYQDFLDEMQELVESLHLQERVIFLPSVSFDLWYDCLSSADLGIALYEATDLNNKNMAGAGNKLNLYLRAGVPSIVPNIPDFVSFMDRFHVGEIADANDPKSIGDKVNIVLRDPKKHENYSCNARQAFVAEYNFEAQFLPVLNRIKAHHIHKSKGE